MPSAEWDQIFELFHAAREKAGQERVALLDTACGEGTPLRKAVEELLRENEAARGFLSNPIFESIRGETPQSPVVPKQRFGRYVMGELIGRGGMGEVWSARDTDLDRPVALKFLSSKTIALLDAEQISREARAASALNHPNIVTIHELVQSHSTIAIVMELVEGETLRYFSGKPLPLSEIFAIALQIARALAAAHGGDIIHGDIKPENILLRRDRYVKVLDFGIARKHNTAGIATAGSPGLGTLRYMSPEQARGEPLTPASDVFSLGLVLYELATGTHAFPAASAIDTAQAILLSQVRPPSVLNSAIPARFDALIRGMLAKDPLARPSAEQVVHTLEDPGKAGGLWPLWRWVMEIAALVLDKASAWKRLFAAESSLPAVKGTRTRKPVALSSIYPHLPAGLNSLIVSIIANDAGARPSAEEVTQESRATAKSLEIRSTGAAAAPAQGRFPRRRIWLASLCSALVVVAILGWLLDRKTGSPRLADLRTQALTSRWGWEGSPTISPDGASVAFTWSDRFDRPEQIYVKQLNVTSLRQLTSSEKRDRIGSLVWSPDGQRLAFKRSAELYSRPGAIYSVSSQGGQEQRIFELRNGNLSSSIDWSPDGTKLVYSDAVANRNQLAIYIFDFKTGQKRRLTLPPQSIWGDWDPRFSPDGAAIAFKRVSGFGADDIYVTPLAGGTLRRVTSGVDGLWGHAWMADGKNLIVSCQRGSTIFGLWRFPLEERDGAPERIVQGAADAVTPSIGRKANLLAWVNQFSDLNIYRVSLKGDSRPEKFIASTLYETQAAYSSTSHVAFLSNRSGSREIWISDPYSSVQTRATTLNGSLVQNIQWSHVGQRLLYDAQTHSIPSVFLLTCNDDDLHCGGPRRLPSEGPAEVPSWSADDRFVYFASDRMGRSEIFKELVNGGPLTQMTHNGGYDSQASSDGKWLYFSKPQSLGIWRIGAGDGAAVSGFPEELVVGPPYRPARGCWKLAGNEIVFIDVPSNISASAAIRAFNLNTRQVRNILSLTPSFFQQNDTRLSVSPDLQWILYSQVDELRSNVMVAENVK